MDVSHNGVNWRRFNNTEAAYNAARIGGPLWGGYEIVDQPPVVQVAPPVPYVSSPTVNINPQQPYVSQQLAYAEDLINMANRLKTLQ